jgi:hypothetical protein
MDKSELLERITTERKRLETALASVDEAHIADPALYGAWSVKDMLAHIGWWEQRAVYVIETVLGGDVPDNVVEGGNIDQVNALVYRENHTRPVQDVRRFEHVAYLKLLSLVEMANEDALFNPQRFAWTKGQPLANWVAWNSYDHYAEHLVELQGWLEQNTQP